MSCDEEVRRVKSVLIKALDSLGADLKTRALTHVSYANEKGPPVASNERLEFLGDAVISLAVAYHLFNAHPDLSEGDLTRMRANLVSGSSLAWVARAGGLGDLLLLGRGEEMTGGRERQRNLASAFEAVVGAVFLEKGWAEAKKLVEETVLSLKMETVPVDPKTLVQELVQRTPGLTLEYKVVGVEGPDHLPTYTVACFVGGKEVSQGQGSSKKDAEENAARSLLEKGFLSRGLPDDKHHFSGDKIGS